LDEEDLGDGDGRRVDRVRGADAFGISIRQRRRGDKGDARYHGSWNRGELPVYLSAYVDSATAMGSNGLVRGVSGIEAQMRAGFWRTGRPLQTLSYDHLEIRPIGPDQAIVTGQYILTGGGRPDRTGWFTTIWVRTARGWRMVQDHSS